MKKHTSLQIGGEAEVFISPDNVNDVVKFIVWAKKNSIPYVVIGDGTNILVKDNGIKGVVIVLTKIEEKFTIQKDKSDIYITVGAGAKLQRLCQFAIKKQFAGLNFALGIPGTVGGAICMNAGTSIGCMEEIIDCISVISDTGQIKEIEKDKIHFSYRQSTWTDKDTIDKLPVIVRCTLKLRCAKSSNFDIKADADKILKNRKISQPLGAMSAGCFFKNPLSGKMAGKTAGEIIDIARLKGTTIGGAKISTHHANFILNTNDAKALDIITLKTKIQKRVWELFKIKLEPEIKIIGED